MTAFFLGLVAGFFVGLVFSVALAYGWLLRVIKE